MPPREEAALANCTNLKEEPSGLPQRLYGSRCQSRDGKDLAVVRAIQIFDAFIFFPSLNPIPVVKHPPNILVELSFAVNFVLDTQAMCSECLT